MNQPQRLDEKNWLVQHLDDICARITWDLGSSKEQLHEGSQIMEYDKLHGHLKDALKNHRKNGKASRHKQKPWI